MGKRFAIVIGVAATGVMALGAQTASSTTGDPVDSTPPDLQLSGPKKQHPQNASRLCPQKPVSARCNNPMCDRYACDVIVQVNCGDEVCTVRATGKLTNVKMDKLDPDGPFDLAPRAPGVAPYKIGPELAKEAQRREVRKALDEGEDVQAKVTVKATDAAGNVATAKRTITLVK
jgi:hypothetical protein